jgi:hypothetical protein
LHERRSFAGSIDHFDADYEQGSLVAIARLFWRFLAAIGWLNGGQKMAGVSEKHSPLILIMSRNG